MTILPLVIDDRASLLATLKAEIGYCECAYDEALPFLHSFLRSVAERTDASHDTDRFREASEELRSLLKDAGTRALRCFFVYALDKADIVSHNFNLYDIWITPRGRQLLDGMNRFLADG